MASYGSLLFYGKNGLSAPYSLSYGKTTIGTSTNHHIRIKCDEEVSCILDTNEVGVTILVNDNENKNILINSLLTKKYTVIEDGDHLEVGKKKFKYSNPSLDKVHLEQTQKTIDKKFGAIVNRRSPFNPPTPLKRLQNVLKGPSTRRFSTGSKIKEAINSPVPNNRKTSTPQSASKVRFSQRMLSRRSSMLASVKENEVFEFQNPTVNFIASPIPKKRNSSLALLESPLARKNKTFSGNSKFCSPILAKNKTYSGNISDVSETVTTPENNVTAASITPLNVSKKTKKSLDRSRTLPYLDFPGNSSTPKSAIKLNRSSSLYKPIVEDITPASPLPRSSLRNSSLKMAFTQRRSVNFNISSSTDASNHQDSYSVEEEKSLSRSKRKMNGSNPDISESSKRRKSCSFKESDNEEQENSLHDSSLSGIQNLSDVSSTSNKNGSMNFSSSNKSKRNSSLKQDSEHPSTISWQAEMSSTNMNLSGLVDTPSKSKISTRSSRNSNLNLDTSDKTEDISKRKERMSEGNKTDEDVNSSDISLHLSMSNNSLDSDLDNTRPSKMDSVLDQSFDSSVRDSEPPEASPSPRRSNVRVQELKKSKARSKSLNLEREINKSIGALSKTVDGNLIFTSSDDPSPFDESHESSSSDKIASTPLVPKRKSSIVRDNSSDSTTRMSLNVSPITPKASARKGSRSVLNTEEPTPNRSLASKLNASLPNFTGSRNQRKSIRSKSVGGNFNLKNAPKTLRSLNASSRSKSSYSLANSRNSSRNLSRIASDSTTRTSLNISPITPKASERKGSRSVLNTEEPTPNERGNRLFASKLNTSLPNFTGSRNQRKSIRSKSVGGNFNLKNAPKTPRSLNTSSRSKSSYSRTGSRNLSHIASDSSKDVSFCDSLSTDVDSVIQSRTSEVLFKTPKTRKSETSKSENDPTDVRSMEKILQKSFENSQSYTDGSYSDFTDQESEVSMNRSSRSNKNTTVNSSKNLSVNTSSQFPKRTTKQQKTPKNDLTNVSGVKYLLKTPKPPKNDLSDVAGVRELLKTPRVRNSPKNDLTNIMGVKNLLKTPKVPRSPKNDLTNIAGVKKLLKTPKVPKSPKNDLTDVAGVKKLLQIPKLQKSPKNDLTDVRGVKKLMASRKVQKSPKNDLTNVAGVKKLLRSPKVQKSPRNDLTDVRGVKKLMATRKVQKSPKNDLTNVAGVKKLMTIPKVQASPKNDLTQIVGLKKLMASPNQPKPPKNDLTNIKGVKKMFSTPKEQKQPRNNLLDVRGIKQLLKTPKNKAADESHDLSGIDILFNESQESNFDKLLDKKPPRTYGRSPKTNKSQTEEAKTPEHVLKWLEDQSKLEQSTTEKEQSKRGKRTSSNAFNTSDENFASADKKRKIAHGNTLNITNELTVSTSILEKPASTPKKIGNRKTRQKNESIASANNSRQTSKKVDLEVVEHPTDHEIEEKKTTRTRAKKETGSISEEPVRNTRGRKAKVQNIDSQESDLNVKEETRRPRRGAGKEPENKADSGKTTKNNKKRDDEENIVSVEVIEPSKEKAEEQSVDVDNGSHTAKRGKYNKKTDEKVETIKPVKRGRKKIDQEKSDEEVEIDKPAKRGRKKIDQEKSQEEVETVKPTRGGKKKIDQEISKEEAESDKPAKRGRKKVDQEPSQEEVEIDKPVKRGRKKEDKTESPIKKNTRTKKVNSDSERNAQTETKKDEIHEEETEVKEKPPTLKKGTRKTKKDITETAIEEETKTTSTNAINEEVENKENLPTKKNTRKGKKTITESEQKEQTTTDENCKEAENKENSPIKKTTRTRKGKTDDPKNQTKTTQADEDENEKKEKVSPIKKTTRRTKKETTELKQTKQTRTALAVSQDENYNEEKDDEKEPAIKKNTRRGKKVDVTDEEIVQTTRNTRANKGKNKKYNEEEWDTPVKKDKKLAVTFKTDVEILETPAKDSTPVGRSLRKRNLK